MNNYEIVITAKKVIPATSLLDIMENFDATEMLLDMAVQTISVVRLNNSKEDLEG